MKRMFFVLVSVIIPAMMFGQTELIRATDGSSVMVEALIPSFDNPPNSTFTGMTMILSGKAALSSTFSLNIEVPYVQSKSGFTSPFGSNSTSKGSLGNIYIGAGIGPATGLLSGDIGLRLGTFKKDNAFAGFSGILGDFPNVARYLADDNFLRSFRAGINIQPSIPGIISLQARVAPEVWIPKSGDETWVLNYAAGVSYNIVLVKVAVGVNGIMKMSKQSWLFGNKDAVHHFQAEANARFGFINPGVMFRVPLDKELDATKFTLGFYVGLVL